MSDAALSAASGTVAHLGGELGGRHLPHPDQAGGWRVAGARVWGLHEYEVIQVCVGGRL